MSWASWWSRACRRSTASPGPSPVRWCVSRAARRELVDTCWCMADSRSDSNMGESRRSTASCCGGRRPGQRRLRTPLNCESRVINKLPLTARGRPCWKIPGGALTSISVHLRRMLPGPPWARWNFAMFIDTLSLVGQPAARRPGRAGWRLVAHVVSRSRRRNPASPAAISPAATTRRIIVADQEMVSRGG
jgi:hypothetical protein